MRALSIETAISADLPAAQAGDTAAFGRIVALSQGAISAIALAITRDPASSEDVAQDAFLAAWSKLRTLQNPGSFLPWLRQITRNLAREQLRSDRVRTQSRAEVELDLAIADVADGAPQPAERLVETERHQVLATVLDALPEDSRELLLLFYREGQRSQQVAALLGLSDASVRKRLSRVRQLVREEFLARFDECVRACAPGTSFTAGVLAALGGSLPGNASAGGLAALVGAGSKGFGALLAPFVGLLIGITGGLAGTWIGLRRTLGNATDAAERAALMRWGAVMLVAVVAFPLALVWATGQPEIWPALLIGAAMFVCYGLACGVWLPRIVARRPPSVPHLQAATLGLQARMQSGGAPWYASARFWRVAGPLLGLAGLLAGLGFDWVG